jgi:hypothetical protein
MNRPTGRDRASIRIALCFCFAAAACLLSASAAQALSVSWGTPVTISGAGEITNPNASGQVSVATDSAGDAIAVWTDWTSADGACPCVIRAASRTAGGSFGSPVNVSSSFGDATLTGGDARVAMDAAGDAVVVWDEVTEPTPGDFETNVRASVRPAGGSFTSPATISGATDTTKGGGSPQVAMDAGGDAVVAWTPAGNNTFPRQIAVARRAASPSFTGGSFSAATDITTASDDITDLDLSISPNGRIAIADTWRAPCTGGGCNANPDFDQEPNNVQLRQTSTFAGAFTAANVLATSVTNPDRFDGPRVEARSVSIDNSGDSVLTYMDASAGWTLGDTVASKALTCDAVTTCAVKSLGASTLGDPLAVIGPTGESTASWTDDLGALQNSSRAVSGDFASPTALDASADDHVLVNSHNAASPTGTALAAWASPAGTDTETIKTASRPTGGSFGSATTIGTSCPNYSFGSLDAAVNGPNSLQLVAWVDDGGVEVASSPAITGGAVNCAAAAGSGGGGGGGASPGSGAPAPTPTPAPKKKCKKAKKGSASAAKKRKCKKR